MNESKLQFKNLKKGDILVGKFPPYKEMEVVSSTDKSAKVKSSKGGVVDIYSTNNYELKENSMKLTNIIKERKPIYVENNGPCWDGYEQIGTKMKGGKEVPNCVPKNEVKEVTHTSAPGEWVGFVSKEKGKKLMGVFKSATGAKSWLTKNQNSLLNQSDVRSVGIKPKKDWDAREAKYAIESVSEATHTSQPGEWVGYIETPKGDKLMGRFKTARAAKMWLNKNNNKLLNTDGVTRVGIMGIDNWNKFHAKWAVESVNEMNVNKKFGSKYDIGAGSMGSGTTFWNRAQEVSGDYKTIAHVSDNGKVTFYDKKLPNDVKKHIEDYAKTKTESVNENTGCGCGGVKTSNPYSLSEFVINEGRNIQKIQKDYNDTVLKLKSTLEKYKEAKGTPNEKKWVDELKKLTVLKKKYQSELDKGVQDLYKDAEYEGE
jgi:hypothetical protein